MNRTRAAFYSFLWVGSGVVLANVFGYLLRILLARNLTVEEYGLVYAIMALFGLVGIFLHWGLPEALTRETALANDTSSQSRLKESVVWVAILLYASSFFLALMGWLLARWLARVYFHDPTSVLPFMIYAVSICLSPIAYILLSIMIGRGRSELYILFTAVQSSLLLLGAWVFLSYGVTGIMFAYALVAILLHILFYPWLGRLLPGFWKADFRLRRATAKRLIRYGFPVMITGVAGMLLSSTDTALLTYFSSIEQVGLYQVALPTANLLLFLLPVITTVLLPILTDLWRHRAMAVLRSSVTDLYAYVLFATIPVAVSAIVFPDLIINLLFGAQYLPAAGILRLLAASSLFLTISAVSTATFSAIGEPSQTSRIVVFGAVLNLFGNLLLIPTYGGVGAAFATLLSSGVIFGAGAFLIRRRLGIRLPFGRWLAGLGSGIVFLVVLYAGRVMVPIQSQLMKAFTAFFIAVVIYGVALLASKALTIKELKDLARRVLKQQGTGGTR